MTPLWTMTLADYRQDVKSRSFWLTTILLPLIVFGIGGFVGWLASGSEAMMEFSRHTSAASDKELSGAQVLGMMCGILVMMFLIMYGSMIFNKIKNEKTGRICEVLVSCTSGRTIMLSKLLSVGMSGLTQMLTWCAMGAGVAILLLPLLPDGTIASLLTDPRLWRAVACFPLYFAGGYAFYGSLMAVAGAVTDRGGENQGFLSAIMMVLMVSFYIGVFAADSTGALSEVCLYLPFTSPTVGITRTVAQNAAWWQTLLSLLLLWGSAWLTLTLAGKLYTSALLLRGKKIGLRDLKTLMNAK